LIGSSSLYGISLGTTFENVWDSWASRLLRLGMLVVVMTLQATYIASLTSILSRPLFEV